MPRGVALALEPEFPWAFGVYMLLWRGRGVAWGRRDGLGPMALLTPHMRYVNGGLEAPSGGVIWSFVLPHQMHKKQISVLS